MLPFMPRSHFSNQTVRISRRLRPRVYARIKILRAMHGSHSAKWAHIRAVRRRGVSTLPAKHFPRLRETESPYRLRGSRRRSLVILYILYLSVKQSHLSRHLLPCFGSCDFPFAWVLGNILKNRFELRCEFTISAYYHINKILSIIIK